MPDSPRSKPGRLGDLEPSRYPGERLGLPERGQMSVARVGRRIIALAVDWGIAVVISMAFFDYDPLMNYLIFAAMQIIFIPTIGGSVGHRIVGLRVIALAGGWVGPWRPLVRTLLLCLVIPALVWDSDQRGFHDTVAGTVLVRL